MSETPDSLLLEKRVDQWSTDDVRKFLYSNGFEKYVDLLCDQHEVDGTALLTLTEHDLQIPPLEAHFSKIGDKKRFAVVIRKLQSSNPDVMKLLGYDIDSGDSPGGLPSQHHVHEHYHKCSRSKDMRHDSTDSMEFLDFPYEAKTDKYRFPPEYRKTVIAGVYMMVATLITSSVMVVVHDRVPDVAKYPPLPDIFLDNFPTIPWAFDVCEYIAVIMMLMLIGTLFFHRHRSIVMRRIFSLSGTVFLLRCISMLITSLSVPGQHLDCAPKTFGDPWLQITRALQIWSGAGMAMQGVRSCGDYMFSGHTCVLTLTNFFITEYTPRSMNTLHTFTWVLNLFGIFFILAAHEHYSIDIFIAFYISTRLFLYYHTLANNRVLTSRDAYRMRIWFPMFSYFESNVQDIVPNEYEWPLPRPRFLKSWFEKRNKHRKKV